MLRGVVHCSMYGAEIDMGEEVLDDMKLDVVGYTPEESRMEEKYK